MVDGSIKQQPSPMVYIGIHSTVTSRKISHVSVKWIDISLWVMPLLGNLHCPCLLYTLEAFAPSYVKRRQERKCGYLLKSSDPDTNAPTFWKHSCLLQLETFTCQMGPNYTKLTPRNNYQWRLGVTACVPPLAYQTMVHPTLTS